MPKGWKRVPELDRTRGEAWRNTENGEVIHTIRGMVADGDPPEKLDWYRDFTAEEEEEILRSMPKQLMTEQLMTEAEWSALHAQRQADLEAARQESERREKAARIEANAAYAQRIEPPSLATRIYQAVFASYVIGVLALAAIALPLALLFSLPEMLIELRRAIFGH